MPKDILSFRVGSRLLAQFTNAALKVHLSPSEVLLAFIGDYVRQVRARNFGDTAGPIPPGGELASGKVVDFARAAERLRIQHAQKEGERLASRFLNGETDSL